MKSMTHRGLFKSLLIIPFTTITLPYTPTAMASTDWIFFQNDFETSQIVQDVDTASIPGLEQGPKMSAYSWVNRYSIGKFTKNSGNENLGYIDSAILTKTGIDVSQSGYYERHPDGPNLVAVEQNGTGNDRVGINLHVDSIDALDASETPQPITYPIEVHTDYLHVFQTSQNGLTKPALWSDYDSVKHSFGAQIRNSASLENATTNAYAVWAIRDTKGTEGTEAQLSDDVVWYISIFIFRDDGIVVGDSANRPEAIAATGRPAFYASINNAANITTHYGTQQSTPYSTDRYFGYSISGDQLKDMIKVIKDETGIVLSNTLSHHRVEHVGVSFEIWVDDDSNNSGEIGGFIKEMSLQGITNP